MQNTLSGVQVKHTLSPIGCGNLDFEERCSYHLRVTLRRQGLGSCPSSLVPPPADRTPCSSSAGTCGSRGTWASEPRPCSSTPSSGRRSPWDSYVVVADTAPGCRYGSNVHSSLSPARPAPRQKAAPYRTSAPPTDSPRTTTRHSYTKTYPEKQTNTR